MKYALAPLILLFFSTLLAQSPRFDFNNGLAISVNYAGNAYYKSGVGFKAEIGYLTQLSVGNRLRGRIGLGISMILNQSKNNYVNNINTSQGAMFRQGMALDLRAGNFNTSFLAIAVPLEYRYVSDGRTPWSLGITYRPGFMLLKSGKNTYTQYDLALAGRQKINETSEITEKAFIKPITDAISLNLGYETNRCLFRLTIGRDQWRYDDDYIGSEGRWLFGFEAIKWLRKGKKNDTSFTP